MVSEPEYQSTETLCLYHNDADGRACAAIVRRALGKDVRLYEINFGESIPWNLIDPSDRVIIVDFSLPLPDMATIAMTKELTWIDHHTSAMDAMKNMSTNWKGIRDISEAACVLTWRYFFPTLPIPRGVILIGDRDIWRMAEADTRAFTYGFRQYPTNPENDSLWQSILDDDQEFIERLVKKGQVLLKAYMNYLRGYVKRYAFKADFEGYKTLCVNRPGEGELVEMICEMGYEIAYCYVDATINNKLMTIVMVGSRVVDVSKLAEKFGGGGHKGAAGFRFERTGNPFPPTANYSKVS
jgi:oligoribonuclease NrnB/cAMP/cGMP phosphodiesterase (DHH superfamily)